MLEFADDDNIDRSDDDGGCYYNLSDNIVLLRRPLRLELQQAWKDFDKRFRGELSTLFKLNLEEVLQQYGSLRFSSDKESQLQTPYGLISTSGKFTNVTKQAVARSMIDLESLSRVNAKGSQRERAPDDRLENIVFKLAPPQQQALIDHLVLGDLDKLLPLDQSDVLGWTDVEELVFSNVPELEILQHIARQVLLFADVQSDAAAGKSTAKGSRRSFAVLWFAQYLASRNIWLFPRKVFGSLKRLYPTRLLPLLPIMSVPEECRSIADKVLALNDGIKTTHVSCPSVFTVAALASTMWETYRFCPWPLHVIRLHFISDNKLSSAISGSINKVYDFLKTEMNVNISLRPDAAVFYNKRRHLSHVRPFNWCFNPLPQNTVLVRRCLRVDNIVVPDHVMRVADELTEIVELQTVKRIDQVVNALDLWLIYQMTLSPDVAPTSLFSIDRHLHVNSGNEGDPTFVNFLREKFGETGKDNALKSIGQLHMAWQLKATLEGCQDLVNPFDPKLDRPFKHRQRGARTARPALTEAVLNKLYEINSQNGFEVARSLPSCWRRLRNPSTGLPELVFWPAVAVCMAVVMKTGMRLKSARWLDSGEGDENVWDPISSSSKTNSNRFAIKGRREGFLREFQIMGLEKSATGMFVNSAKAGAFEFVYCPPELFKLICEMRELVEKYAPMTDPVRAADSGEVVTDYNKNQFAEVFPLFRDARNQFFSAIYDGECRTYLRHLLRIAKPEIDALVGYDYPLVDIEGEILNVHDFRSTHATIQFEKGVDPEIVRDMLGQRTVAMAYYYWSRNNSKVYEEVRQANELSLVEAAAAGDMTALGQIIDQAEKLGLAHASIIEASREVVEGTLPPPFEFFLHGICVAGDCGKGGPLIAGRPGPVWRPRACSDCSFRLTGPAFRVGLKNRCNTLAFEIRASLRRSDTFNSRMEDIEARNGKSDVLLRKSANVEVRLRAHLSAEYRKEYETLQKCEMLQSAALATGQNPSKMLITSNSDGEIKLGMKNVSEFEFLQSLMKDVKFMPQAIFEMPEGAEETWRRHITTVLRANRLDDLMLRIPPTEKNDALLATGDLLIQTFGDPSELQLMLEQSEAGQSNLKIASIAEKLRQATIVSIGISDV